jgi:hypothetical protein
VLLEHAKSAEEVEEVLAGSRGQEEADELREDIEDKLNDVIRRVRDGHTCEYEEFDPRDALQYNDDFTEAVIEQSPSEYDLRLVNREVVQRKINNELGERGRRRHLFDWGSARDVKTSGLSYTFPSQVSCWIGEQHFPDGYQFVPSEFAEKFWSELQSTLGVREWADPTDFLGSNTGWSDGEDIVIGADRESFTEWCRDIISEEVNNVADQHPEEMREMFRRSLRDHDAAQADAFFAAGPTPDDVLDLAVKWFSGDQYDVVQEIEEWLDIVSGPEGEAAEVGEREVVLEITSEDLKKLGITTGTLWENRPWKLIKLEPKDLGREGTAMRHCVGSKGMKYIQAVQNGEIEIWSLRSKDNKPRFTLEVDSSFYTADEAAKRPMTGAIPLWARDVPRAADHLRARAIKQLKGKANRLPGYADKRETDLKFPEEVTLWAWIFDQLDVDASAVEDFSAFRTIVRPEGTQPPRPNTGEACTGFDVPYRPLRGR